MRARNIKPGFFKNEILGTADPLLSILFAGMWCVADRDGKLEDRPLRIKAEIFPYREKLDIHRYLTELSRLGFIQRYEVAGKGYIFIPEFPQHQSPHKTEKRSILPSIPESCALTVNPPLDNRESRPDSLIHRFTDSLIEDSPYLCTEPSASVPPAVSIILNSKTLHPITQKDVDDWQILFPAVDVLSELRKMAAWAEANPTRRKTDKGIRRFIVAWLSKEQDKGRKAPAVFQEPPQKTQKEIEEDDRYRKALKREGIDV